jgi:hypothetical protein
MRFSCVVMAVVSAAFVLAGSRSNSLIRKGLGAWDATGTRESQARYWWLTGQTINPCTEFVPLPCLSSYLRTRRFVPFLNACALTFPR